MKKVLILALIVVGCRQGSQEDRLSAAPPRLSADPAPSPVPSAWEVHFSPRGGCEDAVVSRIDATKHTLLVQAYSFTSRPITSALIRAHDRGVHVEVILDRSDLTAKGSMLPNFQEGRVLVWIDSKHPIAHNKVMVFDHAVVETGSFNYTHQAEHGNAENCLFLQDAGLAARYEENWRVHRGHAE